MEFVFFFLFDCFVKHVKPTPKEPTLLVLNEYDHKHTRNVGNCTAYVRLPHHTFVRHRSYVYPEGMLWARNRDIVGQDPSRVVSPYIV
jgi:hypothetical protein